MRKWLVKVYITSTSPTTTAYEQEQNIRDALKNSWLSNRRVIIIDNLSVEEITRKKNG